VDGFWLGEELGITEGFKEGNEFVGSFVGAGVGSDGGMKGRTMGFSWADQMKGIEKATPKALLSMVKLWAPLLSVHKLATWKAKSLVADLG